VGYGAEAIDKHRCKLMIQGLSGSRSVSPCGRKGKLRRFGQRGSRPMRFGDGRDHGVVDADLHGRSFRSLIRP
jgi:hypothetical protein